jgi:hypothetical protein
LLTSTTGGENMETKKVKTGMALMLARPAATK